MSKNIEEFMDTETDQSMLWERYTLYINLYKFYFNVTLKINAFFLGVSGAILTYYFSHSTVKDIQYSLAFPILIGVSLIVLFIFGICTIGALEHDIKNIVAKMALEVRVTISALYYLWSGSIIILLVASSTMGYLICNHS